MAADVTGRAWAGRAAGCGAAQPLARSLADRPTIACRCPLPSSSTSRPTSYQATHASKPPRKPEDLVPMDEVSLLERLLGSHAAAGGCGVDASQQCASQRCLPRADAALLARAGGAHCEHPACSSSVLLPAGPLRRTTWWCSRHQTTLTPPSEAAALLLLCRNTRLEGVLPTTVSRASPLPRHAPPAPQVARPPRDGQLGAGCYLLWQPPRLFVPPLLRCLRRLGAQVAAGEWEAGREAGGQGSWCCRGAQSPPSPVRRPHAACAGVPLHAAAGLGAVQAAVQEHHVAG